MQKETVVRRSVFETFFWGMKEDWYVFEGVYSIGLMRDGVKGGG